MVRPRLTISLAAAASLALTGVACAGELLQVAGDVVKWVPPAPGERTVITYATLTGSYSFPAERTTLSPDNCGAMHAFEDITGRSPAVPITVLRNELRAAFSAWEQVSDIIFREVADASSANVIIGSADATNGRAFANLSYRSLRATSEATKAPDGKALGGSEPSPAETTGKEAASFAGAAIEQAYICLDGKSVWKVGFDGNLDVYDLRLTFTHEIGHAIGLDHPGSTGAVMGYRYDERVRELQPSDVASVQHLYGPRKRDR